MNDDLETHPEREERGRREREEEDEDSRKKAQQTGLRVRTGIRAGDDWEA